MGNVFLTPDIIAREFLMLLQSNRVMAGLVYRDHEKEFGPAKVGATITVGAPPTYELKEFAGSVVVQDSQEKSLSLTLEKHFDITTTVSSTEWTLDLDRFSEKIIAPAVETFAEGIDAYVFSKYAQVYNQVGAAGDPPDSLEDLAAVEQLMNELRIPARGRNAAVNPKAKASMMGISAVVQADARGDDGTALKEASMGRVMGIDWHMAQNVKSHTAGTLSAGTPAVNSSVAVGAKVMDIDGGVGTETIKAGDIFTVAGADGWYGVFTADVTLSGGAATGVAFEPEAPAGGFSDGDLITIVPSHVANLAFHRNAFTLAIVPLEKPRGAANATYVNYDGMGIRVVYGYDMDSKVDTISFDLLCGAKCIDPRLALRILG